jgi:hypothetical protein
MRIWTVNGQRVSVEEWAETVVRVFDPIPVRVSIPPGRPLPITGCSCDQCRTIRAWPPVSVEQS